MNRISAISILVSLTVLSSATSLAQNGGLSAYGSGEVQRGEDAAEINGVRLTIQPPDGTRVTLVPFAADVPSVQTTIRSVASARRCGSDDPPAWRVTLSPVTEAGWLEAEAVDGRDTERPFEAAVIFPAAPRAAFVPAGSIDAGNLPQYFGVQHLRGGVDMNRDGRADVLYFSYCTGEGRRSQSYTQCRQRGSAIFVRGRERWRMVEIDEPC